MEIERLGRVRNSMIEISPLMIFSGESGMGKSYLALLSHYFFDVLMLSDQMHRLVHLFDSYGYDYNKMSENFLDEGVAVTLSKRQIEEWMENDAINYLRFMLNSDSLDGKITVTLPVTVPETIQIFYKKDDSGLVKSEDKGVILTIGELGYRVSISAINDMNPFAFVMSAYLTDCIFGDIFALKTTFNMPPSRGPVLSENVIGNSGMYKDFIADINELSNVPSNPKDWSPLLKNQLFSIMEGEVKKVDNKFVYLTNGMSMPISAAASSIKEIAPLQLLVSKMEVGKMGILIEEPEAHLHPSKQRMMADIIGCFRNAGAYVQLTTHSDYFLTRINELILFHRYAEHHNEEDTKQLSEKTGIATSFCIDGNDVVGYLVELQADGSSKVIKQNMKRGVPFTSFSNAVREGMRIGDILEEALES